MTIPRRSSGTWCLGLAVLMLAGSPQLIMAAEPRSNGGATPSGSVVLTDGLIGGGSHRRPRPRVRAGLVRTLPNREARDRLVWLFDYIARLLDCEPAAARRHQHPVYAPPPVKMRRPMVVTAKPVPAEPLTFITTTTTSTPATTVAPPPSAIATGALPQPVAMDASEALIRAAERSQLRTDQAKLELTTRTYDEQRPPGASVFTSREDWRVLERMRDALSGAELASAKSTGFEANAYINETARTVVVAVAGTQDLRRDFLAADIWKALIVAQAPQHFYLAKTYVRGVIERFAPRGYTIECVGHSLGGGACAYVAGELGIRALVVNPISAGKLAPAARLLVTNYVVDGDIANLVYRARGNEFAGDVQVINDGRDVIRLMALEKYGQLAGPVLVVRELRASVENHKVEHALDLIASQAEMERPR